MSCYDTCNRDFHCHPVREIWLLTWALFYAKIFINWCCRFLVMSFFLKHTLFMCLCHTISWNIRYEEKQGWVGRDFKIQTFTNSLHWDPKVTAYNFTYWKIWKMFTTFSLSPLQNFSQPMTKRTSAFFVFSCSCIKKILMEEISFINAKYSPFMALILSSQQIYFKENSITVHGIDNLC